VGAQATQDTGYRRDELVRKRFDQSLPFKAAQIVVWYTSQVHKAVTENR